MSEELMQFDLPVDRSSIIKVVGIGGGGGNAVNYMYNEGIKDVNFVVCNTDAQALSRSPVSVQIQLGESLTEGRGAGNKPEIGRGAAIESLDQVMDILSSNTRMVFLTAGMGGGTGTGAIPIIAKAASEQGILTVAIVTIPFRFEGQKRIHQAIEGIHELGQHVDSLLVINNEKLREVAGNMKLSEAFSHADNILAAAAKGIAEIITVPGYINVDFADVETVLTNSGVALMGTGIAKGEDRAVSAVQQALSSPLLNDNDISGTENILLNITFGNDEITMDEIGEIADFVNNEVGSNPNIIWGTGFDEKLEDQISITIIATGFESNSIPELYAKKTTKKTITLEDEESKSKPKPKSEKKQEPIPSFSEDINADMDECLDFKQRTIDFDIKKDRESDKYIVLHQPEDESEIAVETKKSEIEKKLKESRERMKERRMESSKMKDNIDEIENEPAYKRKNLKIDQPAHSKDSKVSRYSLEDDEEENTTRLRPNNSYLHDNVD